MIDRFATANLVTDQTADSTGATTVAVFFLNLLRAAAATLASPIPINATDDGSGTEWS